MNVKEPTVIASRDRENDSRNGTRAWLGGWIEKAYRGNLLSKLGSTDDVLSDPSIHDNFRPREVNENHRRCADSIKPAQRRLAQNIGCLPVLAVRSAGGSADCRRGRVDAISVYDAVERSRCAKVFTSAAQRCDDHVA